MGLVHTCICCLITRRSLAEKKYRRNVEPNITWMVFLRHFEQTDSAICVSRSCAFARSSARVCVCVYDDDKTSLIREANTLTGWLAQKEAQLPRDCPEVTTNGACVRCFGSLLRAADKHQHREDIFPFLCARSFACVLACFSQVVAIHCVVRAFPTRTAM